MTDRFELPKTGDLKTEDAADAAWLDAVHRDLARDTAEAAYLELCTGPVLPAGIASAALDLIVDHVAGIMGDVYAAIGLTDPGAIGRGCAIMREAFVGRFEELAAQADANGRGGC